MPSIKKNREPGVFKTLSLPGRLRYIWDYYKLQMAASAIVLYIILFAAWRHFTAEDPFLYAGLVNVAVSGQLEEKLTDGFIRSLPLNPSENPVRLYKALYLTDNTDSQFYQYTYASQMKILAAIDDEQLDVVFLDKEAFDAFAQNGYLYDLDTFFHETALSGASSAQTEDALYDLLSSSFVSNMEILEDNAKEVALDPSASYQASTREYAMGLRLLDFPMLRDAGFTDELFLCILANTPRKEAVIEYVRYLTDIR